MPKTRHPVADYITFETYQKMLKDEQDPIMKLLYRYIWTFMLRVSEAVGQSQSDVKQLMHHREISAERIKKIKANPKLLREYKIRHQGREPKIRHKWGGRMPGIRPCDIDQVHPKDVGLDSDHTLRVYRKMGKFKIFPFSDMQLYDDTRNGIMKGIADPEERLFPFLRQHILKAMEKHGYTVGGQTRIHPHALRRGAGVYMIKTGRLTIQDLQIIYDHANMAQTLAYIGIDEKEALNRFARAQVIHVG